MIKALQAAGANAEIRFRDTLEYQPTTYQYVTIRQQFFVGSASAAPTSAGSQPTEFVLTIQRAKLPRESMSRWLVSRIDDAKGVADSTLTH